MFTSCPYIFIWAVVISILFRFSFDVTLSWNVTVLSIIKKKKISVHNHF